MIYTTNAIESLNNIIRKAIKKGKLFPTDESARQGDLLSDPRSLQEMDDTNSNLATSYEPLYDYVQKLTH
ncbi:hypothetical protein EM91_010070 [Vibrio parahaemolyticus]|nr:hypothetical protein EM91_010070 [Vibrio parahaemolyticus]